MISTSRACCAMSASPASRKANWRRRSATNGPMIFSPGRRTGKDGAAGGRTGAATDEAHTTPVPGTPL